MEGKKVAAIVTAWRPRSGTSPLAHVLVEYFILSHATAADLRNRQLDRRLSLCIPDLATVIDLDRIQVQMAVFDTLASAASEKRMVDEGAGDADRCGCLLHCRPGFRILRTGADCARSF